VVENRLCNLPSGENIPKKFRFLWRNRLLELKIAEVFLKLNLFLDFEDTTPLVYSFPPIQA